MAIPQSTSTRLAFSLLAGSSLIAVSPAYAQETAEEEDETVITVTALKREQNLQDVPLAITALGTEQLEELQINDLEDAVKFLPSVSIQASQGSPGPGFSQVYFRGVASGENANHSTSQPTVGTYLDEMPITTIQGALDIHAYDLNRIEALAGPQGTLYGASSMGGTIKLVTNPPDPGSTYGAVDLELNSVAHGDMGGVAEGFINMALSPTAAMRLVAWYRHDGGYIDNISGTRLFPTSGIVDDNNELVEENYNDIDTYGARLALGIDLNDSWTIRPTVMGQVTEYNGTFAQERSVDVNDELQTVQYNPEFVKDEWIQAALTIEGQLGSWDLVATGGYLWRHDEVFQDYSDYSYFYDWLYGSGVYMYDDNGTLISPNQYVEGEDRYRRWFGEARVSSPAENRLRLIAGLFAQRQTHGIEQHYIIDNLTSLYSVTGTVDNIWLTKQERVDRDYAAFGELSFDITDQLTATGGIRVFHYKNSLQGFFGASANWLSTGEAQCFGPPIVAGSPCTNVDKVTSDTDFIHKLNLAYDVTEDVMVYATWSRGFRPGGINRRGTLPPYFPDKLDNYELGWKAQFGDFHLNGAIYQEDWDDIQLSFLGLNGLSEVRNAGVARIRGIELDFGYRANGLTFNLGGSYNDAEIREGFCAIANETFDCALPGADGAANALLAPAGTRLPITPKFKGNAVVRYEFPLFGMWDGHVQGAVSHVSSRRSDLRTFENALKGTLGGFTAGDISIGADTGTYRVELFATNLFDSNGKLSTNVQCLETTCGDPDGLSPTGGIFYDTVIRPRTIGIKVGADF